MDKMVRTDWKRHSAPYDLTFDYTVYEPVDAVVDQAMRAFVANTGQSRTSTIGRDRKKSESIVCSEKSELSTDEFTPGVLKVFGETIFPGVQYKSVLASCRSTAQELVKEALERFGLSLNDHENYVLCDVVGTYGANLGESQGEEDDVPKSDKWERVFVRILADRDKPLLLQKFWKPIDGYSRRYELHERSHVTDLADDDDTSGLNQNARKILISKLRPGAIPLFDATSLDRDSNGLRLNINGVVKTDKCMDASQRRYTQKKMEPKMCSSEHDTAIPSKHPFFVNIRGFDVEKDKTVYVIKSKRFTFGSQSSRAQKCPEDVPKFTLYSPDIEPVHCNVKVYKFKKSNGVSDSVNDRNNYFLELEPVAENICVNGHRIHGKILIKSGDIINIGIYYVLLFKDCSKGNDIPLSLPWLPVTGMSSADVIDNADLKLNLCNGEDESNSNTDESVDASIAERMSFAYMKEKEDDLIKYICAIIQQQNTCKTYSLTVAFLFSMCIEHASRKFERRQLKHLFLRILFTVRENVAETAKSLSACKFSCTLLDVSVPPSDKDRKLERLLLWISNCVQLLLFLKHTFQLSELPLSDRGSSRGRDAKSNRKEENAKHALGQLVTGLEEIIMFCFQQCVYTITKALHPVLPALLDSNPFNDGNSEQCSMEDVIRMFERLAEVTHSVMLHEGITRQLFTYLFFFTNINIFNKLLVDEVGIKYYNWQCGVWIRANLSQLEDWATQNGLEDEFSQMFERLLAVSELLATSKNTLVKYQWPLMKTHYQPLTSGQLYHVLSNYQMGGKPTPVIWTPSQEDLEQIHEENVQQLPLSSHPPFALPDNCGMVDLIRSPEDTSFWNHVRRLKSLYGVTEDDSDSGFSISNTPRGSCSAPKSDMSEHFFEQENNESPDEHLPQERRASHPESSLIQLIQKQRSRVQVKKCNTNPWSFKVPKQGTGVCDCAGIPTEKHTTSGTLTDDLMEVEQRERVEITEANTDSHKDKNKYHIKSGIRESKIEVETSKTFCKSEEKGKVTIKKYQKNVRPGNVADCSARTLPKSLQNKERIKLKQLQSRISQAHSFSVDDLPLRLMKHRPSASFEEAIERGYTSDTYHCKSESISETEEDNHVTTETSGTNKSSHKTRVLRNGIKRHSSLVSESVSSDEVFLGETTIDTLYSGNQNGIVSQSMLCKKSFKPVPTSGFPALKLRTNCQKMTSLTFESDSRRSSIELTKDELFIDNHGDDKVETDIGTDMFEQEVHEPFPGELLTEVNESTLAALKRHGSSLNVAPSSENSPRTISYEQVSEVLGPDDTKQMAPCPLFTVYLKKGDTGLGLGLIDGLHTPLRLAGIYIRKILTNSPAAHNGCLQIGDRVLAVDGKSVIGADYQSTMNAIKDAGETLTLLVARGNESMATKVSVSQV